MGQGEERRGGKIEIVGTKGEEGIKNEKGKTTYNWVFWSVRKKEG